jgi:hypothetical protein
MRPILAAVSRGPRFDSMLSARPGAPDSGGRGRRGCGSVVVGDARALIHQNDMRHEFRDTIDIACDYYCEKRRAADNESAYWGRREGFLRWSSNDVLGPRPSSSGLGEVRALSSSASNSSASLRAPPLDSQK